MFSVSLDEFCNLIFYSQLIAANLKMANKPFISTSKNQKTAEVKEILFGSLLGDGSLEMPPRELNARFGFVQSLDKKRLFFKCIKFFS